MDRPDEAGLSAETQRQLDRELAQLSQQRATALARNEPEVDEVVAWLDRRVTDIKTMLAHGSTTWSLLEPGTMVTLRHEDGLEERLRVVATAAERSVAEAVLTADSSLGHALAGRSAGETVTYRMPQGERSLTILAIETPATT